MYYGAHALGLSGGARARRFLWKRGVYVLPHLQDGQGLRRQLHRYVFDVQSARGLRLQRRDAG